MASARQADHRAEISLDWLIRLRWGAVAGQVATIAVAWRVLRAPLPLGRLVGLVLALFVSNLLLATVRRPAAFPRALCGAALTLDTLLLTGLLHATGGASNPFSVLYLVYITLAAVVLGARWTWSLAALSVGCYGLLFATQLPLEHAAHLAPEMQLHLQGMWVAFCVAAVLTAYFVVQMSTAIERRDAEMSAMRDRAARSERLASLTTLAAGAAHELGTPLATIAVAARELERSIRTLPGAQAAALVEDAALIRSEVDRCRAILNRLGAQVGQTPGEAPVEITAAELLEAVVRSIPERERARLETSAQGDAAVRVPRNAVLQVAANLLRNALDAGEGSGQPGHRDRPGRPAARAAGRRARHAARGAGPRGGAVLLDEGAGGRPRPGCLHRPLALRADGRTAHAGVESGTRHDGARRDPEPRCPGGAA